MSVFLNHIYSNCFKKRNQIGKELLFIFSSNRFSAYYCFSWIDPYGIRSHSQKNVRNRFQIRRHILTIKTLISSARTPYAASAASETTLILHQLMLMLPRKFRKNQRRLRHPLLLYHRCLPQHWCCINFVRDTVRAVGDTRHQSTASETQFYAIPAFPQTWLMQYQQCQGQHWDR